MRFPPVNRLVLNMRQDLGVLRNRIFVRLFGTDGRTQRMTFYWSVIATTLGVGVLLLSYPQTYAMVATRLVLGVQNFGAWFLLGREMRAKFGPKPSPSGSEGASGQRAAFVVTAYFAFLASSLILAGDLGFATWFIMASIPIIGFLWEAATTNAPSGGRTA